MHLHWLAHYLGPVPAKQHRLQQELAKHRWTHRPAPGRASDAEAQAEAQAQALAGAHAHAQAHAQAQALALAQALGPRCCRDTWGKTWSPRSSGPLGPQATLPPGSLLRFGGRFGETQCLALVWQQLQEESPGKLRSTAISGIPRPGPGPGEQSWTTGAPRQRGNKKPECKGKMPPASNQNCG